MSWLNQLNALWTKQAGREPIDLGLGRLKTSEATSDAPSQGDDSQSSGPPNLRQSTLGNSSCMSCQYYDNVLGQCKMYGTRTMPNQVCDSWDGGQAPDLGGGGPALQMPDMPKIGSHRKEAAAPGNVMPSTGQPTNALSPLKPMAPLGGGQQGRPQAQPPKPGQPNFQGMQPQNQAWRPSAVAQVAAAKGDPNAWVYSLFKPQQQGAATPMKTASCVISELFVKQFTKRANIGPLITSLGLGAATTMGPGLVDQALTSKKKKPPVRTPLQGTIPYPYEKDAALHSIGDPLPKDWNNVLREPSKLNGGLPSHGREAWDSMVGYRRKGSDKDNFDKAWHMKKRSYVTNLQVDPRLAELAHKRLVELSNKGPSTLAKVESTSLPPIEVSMQGKKKTKKATNPYNTRQ